MSILGGASNEYAGDNRLYDTGPKKKKTLPIGFGLSNENFPSLSNDCKGERLGWEMNCDSSSFGPHY